MQKEISIDEIRLIVLEEARRVYIRRLEANLFIGLCAALSDARSIVRARGGYVVPHISGLIPDFDEACRKFGGDTMSLYYWPKPETEPRIKVLDYLIDKYR